MTEAEENPIYGDISLSLRRQHGGGGWGVRSIRGAALVLCVCGKVAPYNKQSSGSKDRPR